MTLLAPLALWGLLALAVPLLLHLRRRRVGRTIQVGSLKHLETLPTAERRGPRVRDPVRLLLRLAIVGLLALVLARPVLEGPRGDATPVILVDTQAPAGLRDSLAARGELLLTDLSHPWEAIARIDDSLPPGRGLLIAATRSSDRYSGPRPLVRRDVEWIDVPPSPAATRPQATDTVRHTARERRALDAAIAATTEFLGTPADTAGWEGGLPRWWPDSLDSPAFPVAVARALVPARALPAPVELGADQIRPGQLDAPHGGTILIDLHWWLWAFAAALFLIERLWARRLEHAR